MFYEIVSVPRLQGAADRAQTGSRLSADRARGSLLSAAALLRPLSSHLALIKYQYLLASIVCAHTHTNKRGKYVCVWLCVRVNEVVVAHILQTLNIYSLVDL